MSPDLALHQEVVEAIKPHLAGLDPAITSAVLAELIAMYLTGYSKTLRPMVLNEIVDLAEVLVGPIEGIRYRGAGHPADRH